MNAERAGDSSPALLVRSIVRLLYSGFSFRFPCLQILNLVAHPVLCANAAILSFFRRWYRRKRKAGTNIVWRYPLGIVGIFVEFGRQ